MKTWEMIKILDESPEKRFRNKKWKDFVVTADDKGILCYNKQVFVLNLNGEWEEIIEPVDFVEIVEKSKYNAVCFKVKHNLLTGPNKNETFTLTTFLDYIGRTFFSRSIADILSTGEFYIITEGGE